MNQNNFQLNNENRMKANPHCDFIKSDIELEDELKTSMILIMNNYNRETSLADNRSTTTSALIPVNK